MDAYNILIAGLFLIIGIILGRLGGQSQSGEEEPDELTQRLEEAKLQARDITDPNAKAMACQQYQQLKDGIMQVETGNPPVQVLTPEQKACLDEILEILCN